MSGSPRMTDKVRRGLWMIVARSATVMQAEEPDSHLPKDERECILAAVRYAEAHWHPWPEVSVTDLRDD